MLAFSSLASHLISNCFLEQTAAILCKYFEKDTGSEIHLHRLRHKAAPLIIFNLFANREAKKRKLPQMLVGISTRLPTTPHPGFRTGNTGFVFLKNSVCFRRPSSVCCYSLGFTLNSAFIPCGHHC